jgi:hypothetical protein
MAIQLSTAVRNAMLDAIETTVGTVCQDPYPDRHAASNLRDGRKRYTACSVYACL